MAAELASFCKIFRVFVISHYMNYSGITLLSVVGKLFTSILNTRLNEWAEKYHIYVEAQSGFRKGTSTVDNIFVLHSLITHCVNEKKKLYSAIDFKLGGWAGRWCWVASSAGASCYFCI